MTAVTFESAGGVPGRVGVGGWCGGGLVTAVAFAPTRVVTVVSLLAGAVGAGR